MVELNPEIVVSFCRECKRVLDESKELSSEEFDEIVKKSLIERVVAESFLFSLLKAKKRSLPAYLQDWEDLFDLSLQVTWNAPPEELEGKKTGYLVSGLYVFDVLGINEFRSILRHLYLKLDLDVTKLITGSHLIKSELNDRETGLKFLIEFFITLGHPIPSSDEFMDRWPEKSRELLAEIELLRERRDYLDDFVNDENFDLVDLNHELLPHDISSLLMEKVMERTFQQFIDGSNPDETFQLEDIETKLEPRWLQVTGVRVPLNLQVTSSLMKAGLQVQALPINMERMARVPKGMEMAYASRFVYELTQKPDHIEIHILGGRGIGHSAILIRTRNGTVLMDFGMSVVNYSLPFWHPLLKTVDCLLLSHAHLDHCGGLPFLYKHCYSGPWFSCKPTEFLVDVLLRDNSKLLLSLFRNKKKEYPAVSSLSSKVLNKIITGFQGIKFNETVEILPGVLCTPYPASHIYGSAGYVIDFGFGKLLYTGDFNAGSTALFKGAQFPESDLTLFDGTYYGRKPSKTDTLKKILEESKKIIIPAFSVGRSQEMLQRLLLEEAGSFNIHVVGMASRICKLANIKGDYKLHAQYDPSSFSEGEIVISGGGMLQGGTARSLLELTRDDDETAVALCGYQAPGTLGWCLRENKSYAKERYKQKVFNVSASGHSSDKELKKFIKERKEPKFMLHTPISDQAELEQLTSYEQLSIESKGEIITIKPKW